MMNNVVASLQKEYSRLEAELGRVGKALDALGGRRGNKLRTGRTQVSISKSSAFASTAAGLVRHFSRICGRGQASGK
jgi:hypothetical protein